MLLLLALGSMTPVRAQSGCELYISTDFDSECLITEYIKCSPQLWELGLQDYMLACKGNTVTYSAVCGNNSINPLLPLIDFGSYTMTASY